MTVDEGTENMIHHRLECGGRVGESKIHDHRFPDAKARFEGRFPLVAVSYMDVIIPPSDVERGKYKGVGQRRYRLLDVWQGGIVFDRITVYDAVVLYWA